MSRLSISLFALTIATLTAVADDPPASQPEQGEWMSLFNGTDLSSLYHFEMPDSSMNSNITG